MSRIPSPKPCWLAGVAGLAFLLAQGVGSARTADRDLPADIDAGAMSRVAGLTELSKGVVLRQGTLEVRSEDAVVSTDDAGQITDVQLTGSPAIWREQMDDGAQLDAEAKQIDYDFKTEQVVLTGDVIINHGTDQITGEQIRYDLRTSRLDAGSSETGRIRMRITPTSRDGDDDGQ